MTVRGENAVRRRIRSCEAAGLEVELSWHGVTDVGLRREVNQDSYVATPPIFAVADTTTLLAKAMVGEAQIAELSVGTPVKISLNAYPGQEFKGVLTRLSPSASVPTRTFTAEVSIPNPNQTLKVGMYANAYIGGQVRKNVLAVPEGALVLREDQKTVFVVLADNKVMQRVLKLGDAAGGWVEVRDGVKEGERIVVAGQHKLKDGLSVRLEAAGGQQTK